MIAQIAVAATISALVQLALHWFPWPLLLGKMLPRVPAYIAGVLGILIPASILLYAWSEVAELALVWACSIASGLAVVLAYTIDQAIHDRNRAQDMKDQVDLMDRL